MTELERLRADQENYRRNPKVDTKQDLAARVEDLLVELARVEGERDDWKRRWDDCDGYIARESDARLRGVQLPRP